MCCNVSWDMIGRNLYFILENISLKCPLVQPLDIFAFIVEEFE
jgi:hypothetical protein